ncbi:hypothetical protein LWI28_006092 [Acer negundo]|uniref:Uncharacterized protein n=1 Tax=Acer negundo TaxID=4023 RepID=A0AAD5P047_ACENE|nr:hypothetical protein LWI28_006092 [Acer negundo]
MLFVSYSIFDLEPSQNNSAIAFTSTFLSETFLDLSPLSTSMKESLSPSNTREELSFGVIVTIAGLFHLSAQSMPTELYYITLFRASIFRNFSPLATKVTPEENVPGGSEMLDVRASQIEIEGTGTEEDQSVVTADPSKEAREKQDGGSA